MEEVTIRVNFYCNKFNTIEKCTEAITKLLESPEVDKLLDDNGIDDYEIIKVAE